MAIVIPYRDPPLIFPDVEKGGHRSCIFALRNPAISLRKRMPRFWRS